MDEAVEVVGIDGILVLYGGHAEGFPQVVGDEGGLASGFGQLPFVEGEHDEVAEVEVTRFQHTHYLHADGGFSVEGNVGRGKQAVQQSLQRVCAHTTQFAGLYQAEQAVDEGVAFEQRLAVQLVEDVFHVFFLAVEDGHFAKQFGEVAA